MRIILLCLCLLIFISCHLEENASIENTTLNDIDTATEAPSFFPLGNFIKGQIVDIKNSGINPIIIRTVNDLPDTSWIKVEALENEIRKSS